MVIFKKLKTNYIFYYRLRFLKRRLNVSALRLNQNLLIAFHI